MVRIHQYFDGLAYAASDAGGPVADSEIPGGYVRNGPDVRVGDEVMTPIAYASHAVSRALNSLRNSRTWNGIARKEAERITPEDLAAFAASLGYAKTGETYGDHTDIWDAPDLPELLIPRHSALGDWNAIVERMLDIFLEAS